MLNRIIDDITNFIFLNDEIQLSDIIFIPGGSNPELGEYAAELLKQGLAPIVMPTGGVSIKTGKFNGVKTKKNIYNKDYSSDCEFLVDVLKINGVPPNSIIEENTSGFTKENATFSQIVCNDRAISVKKAIICCKSFHTRRSLMCYQFAFPTVKFFVHAVPYYEGDIEISAHNWFKTEVGIKRVLGEVQRCANQFNEEFIGLLNTRV